jgi:hypothetical protein
MNATILNMPKNETETQFYKFKIYIEEQTHDGKKTKTVGMAYLRSGERTYTLRLWTYLKDKFYLLPSKDDATKYLIFSKEDFGETKKSKRQFWNVIGSGNVDTTKGHIELFFDLLPKKICVNLFPEERVTHNDLKILDHSA